jgi:hypothetical protein
MNGERGDADRTAFKGLTPCELGAAVEFRRQGLGGEPA